MQAPDQARKAEAFRRMHSGDPVLLLPNVWDVASARVVEQAGYRALATTSAGIAFALGYPDGEQIPKQEMLSAIARIARNVGVPVTADVEAAYGATPDDAAWTARAVIEAGAIGMNLEDATGDPAKPVLDLSLQLEQIRAIRETSADLNVSIVLNARTDVDRLELGEPGTRYDETLRRVSAFRDAGADCVFVPGLRDLAVIERLVGDLRCPLNILGGPGAPSSGELQRVGVARVSLGSGPMRASLGLLRRIAEEFKTSGTYEQMLSAPSHADINGLMHRN